MVSLPPTSLPPVQPALAGGAAPPLILPAQVTSAALQSQLLRDVTAAITAAQVVQQPAQLLPSAQTSAQVPALPLLPPVPAPAATPAQLLLSLQTSQGAVQLSLPATLPPLLLATLPTNLAAKLPSPPTLTLPQWQQLLDSGQVQVQLSPVPSALLQRLPAGAPPILAQLLIAPRALSQLFGASVPTPAVYTAANPGVTISLGNPQLATPQPPAFTATLLPPELAESYKSRFGQTLAANPDARPQTSVTPSLLQQAATGFRTWFAPGTKPAADAPPVLPHITLTLDSESPLSPGATRIEARLLGITPNGDKLLLLTESDQLLLAPHGLPLTSNKPVTLRLLSLGSAATQNPLALPSLPTSTALEAQTPVLTAAIAALAAAPALAAQLTRQTIVQPGTLAPTLLFLFAAIQGSAPSISGSSKPLDLHTDLRAALNQIEGDGIHTLPLAERLLTELRQVTRQTLAHDESGQAWRALTLPTQTGETLQAPVTFYFQQPLPRQHPDGDGPAQSGAIAGAKQTRFIVDLQLSRLGQTQLEGLSRARQLDLTLRTAMPLPATLQAELITRYADITAATGLSGTLQITNDSSRMQRFTNAAHNPHLNASI